MDKLKRIIDEIKFSIPENHSAKTQMYDVFKMCDIEKEIGIYKSGQVVHHKMYSTKWYNSFDAARDELIALVKGLVAGAYYVFWRRDPTMLSQKDFHTGNTKFCGVVRLSVLKKGEDKIPIKKDT